MIEIDERAKKFLYFSVIASLNVKGVLKAIYKSFFKKYQIRGKLENMVFINSVKREDHISNFYKIYDCCTEEKNMCQFSSYITVNFRNIIAFFTQIKSIKKINNFSVFGKENKAVHSLKFKIIYYFRLLEYKGIIQMCNLLDLSKVSCLVCYADVLLPEHVLVKTANERGIKTVTCQHGIYPVDTPVNSIDVLNYWESPSDYALVWGDLTNRQFKKYSSKTKTVICGNLSLTKESYPDTNEVIGVATDIPAYKKYNQAMIDIAEEIATELNMKVWIRLHPTDHKENYYCDSSLTQFRKDIESTKYILAHTSTMLFSYMIQGKKVFKYQSEVIFYKLDRRICFKNSAELYEAIKNVDKIDYSVIIEPFFSCIDEKAKQNYKYFFQTILNQDK